MAITIETAYNAPNASLKLHCKTCPKTLESLSEQLREITNEDLILFMGYAELHTKKHPKHSVTIYERKRVPTARAIREA